MVPYAERYGIDHPPWIRLGWPAVESGFDYSEVTSYDERGYFQLMPDESKSLGLDHARLSTDPEYSYSGGIALLEKYSSRVAKKYGLSSRDELHYRLVKLTHAVPAVADALVSRVQQAGYALTWDAIAQYGQDNESALLHDTGHSPSKWIGNVNAVYDKGNYYQNLVNLAEPASIGLGLVLLGAGAYFLLSKGMA